MVKRVTWRAGAALLACLVAAPLAAAAAPQTTSERDIDETIVSDDFCSFPLVFHFVGRVEVKTYFDRDGTPVRARLHGSEVATVTNPANGKSVSGHEVLNTFTDLTDGTSVQVGIPIHWGSALIDAGRVVLDADGAIVSISGNHERIEGDFTDLCAALGDDAPA